MYIRYPYFVFTCFFTFPAYSAQFVKQQLETLFATSHLLTQSDAVTVGYGHFDPQALINPTFKHLNENNDNDFKQQLNVFSMPLSIEIEPLSPEVNLSILGQMSYLEKKQSIDLFNRIADSNKDYLYNLSMGLQVSQFFSVNWRIQSDIHLQYMHYENEFIFNSLISKNILAPAVNNISANISSNALLINPKVVSVYSWPTRWGKYEFKSELSYFYGRSYTQSEQLPTARPEGWQFINGVKAKFAVGFITDVQPAFYIKAHRVDLAADSKAAFEVDHFYEYGLGVLFDVRSYTSWFNNLGVGINIHTGSVLDGGSLVFYFNEF